MRVQNPEACWNVLSASHEAGAAGAAPAGAVKSWLCPPSWIGGEPRRCSSAVSAGGGHSPAPSAADITGYSSDRPTGAIVTVPPGALVRPGPIVTCAGGGAW